MVTGLPTVPSSICHPTSSSSSSSSTAVFQCDVPACAQSNTQCKQAMSSPLTQQQLLSPVGRVYYVHIPKTGGTAVEDAGALHGFGWGKNDRHVQGVGGKMAQAGGDNICQSAWHEPFHYAKRSVTVQQPNQHHHNPT